MTKIFRHALIFLSMLTTGTVASIQDLASIQTHINAHKKVTTVRDIDYDAFLNDPEMVSLVVNILMRRYERYKIHAIISTSQRGMQIANPLSKKLNTQSFSLKDLSLKKGDKVIILDDFLKTTNEVNSHIEMITKNGAEIFEYVSIFDDVKNGTRNETMIPVYAIHMVS